MTLSGAYSPAFSDEEIETIRKSAAGHKRNIAIVDILLSSGIRVSELVRLNRSSINLENRTCIVFGKGTKQRVTYFDVHTKIDTTLRYANVHQSNVRHSHQKFIC